MSAENLTLALRMVQSLGYVHQWLFQSRTSISPYNFALNGIRYKMKSYAQKGDLTVHLKSHAYRPQPCNEDGCDPTIIYTTWSKMERHRNQKHSNWSPRTCSLCTGAAKDKPWLTRNEWRMHLTRKHKMTSEAIDEHLAATGEDLVVRESTSSKAESNNQLDLL